MSSRDSAYLATLLTPIQVSAAYRPKFGRRRRDGLRLAEFQDLYASDPFYSWLGLDTPLVYAAHKAAGGITSIYRQIGIGCERLIRQILCDALGLEKEDVKWSYAIPEPDGRRRRLSLDGRIPLCRIPGDANRKRVEEWMRRSAAAMQIESNVTKSLSGVVFEVRQGYKSKDSKRQNADIANASAAYTQSYLPCALVLSQQIDEDILDRYRLHRWMVLTGDLGSDDAMVSTYDFLREVIGYDLAAFFDRHQTTLHRQLVTILETLLSAETDQADP